MIASAPFIPLNGGSPTLYALLALLVGTGFGFFLERAGFGSAKKLTSVFTLRDWQVYKVMFTALITALVGSQIFSSTPGSGKPTVPGFRSPSYGFEVFMLVSVMP